MSRYSPATIQVTEQHELLFGSLRDEDDSCRVTIAHQSIAENHAALLRSADRVWVVRLDRNASSLFVDGNPVEVTELSDQSIVQLGPFGWSFRADTSSLHPLTPMIGRSLELDASVPGRLLPCKLTARAGHMIAITGPSGCGKSTLLNAIRSGQSAAQGDLYFMQQRDLVHEDLRVKDQLEFVARFYGNDDVLPCDIDDSLCSVGLSQAHAERFPRELSGGELRRARIAAALLSKQGLVILDEPDSGLDHETAMEIIGLLRSFSLRGATVIAVTHHRHVLPLFDRVIELEKTPEGGRVVLPEDDSAVDQSDGPAKDQTTRIESLGFVQQFPLLLRREWKKFVSPKLFSSSAGSRLRIPACSLMLLLVPLFFAVAISISVPTDPDRDLANGLYGEAAPIHRLGFLAVISVIWMAASLSHLCLARERELYDHEHAQGVTWHSLLSAKFVVYTGAAFVQSAVFLLLLHLIRHHWLDRSYFVSESATVFFGVAVCIAFVSTASTALGLLVSSVAGRRPLVAAGILPVLMMIQILFSVAFAVTARDTSNSMSGYQQLAWSPSAEDIDQEDLPMHATAVISYGTLSRFGDCWLRSFVGEIEPGEESGAWQRTGALGLSAWAMVYFGLSVGWLRWANRRNA